MKTGKAFGWEIVSIKGFFINVFRQLSTQAKRACETENHLLCGWVVKGYTKKLTFLIQ